MKRKPQVIDFFCGAGGFSEGFRQQGFDVAMGIDNWAPAIKTHNLNHNLNDQIKDVLDFGSSITEIDNLPNTEVIVGSPPCVLFSLSNKGGKSDKTLGIQLIESFLRVIAVKKNQPSSNLVAWFMENVPNSKNYIKPTYTFRELKLEEWAKNHKIDPDKIALNSGINGQVLNTADFGTTQKRERYVCGEIVKTGKFPDLHSFVNKQYRISIGETKSKMPSPSIGFSKKIYTDPNYPSIKLQANQITDHFYDSGVYESQWKNAQSLKQNHPFMGKMSFPEDERNPSRTIMATRSASTREALIYKSEYKRSGDGEYRLPTIREIATLMGFPYSYQFSGGENTKWRQIGNAVCPPMSSALAKSVRISMGLEIIPKSKIRFNLSYIKNKTLENLNTFSEKKFDTQPTKKATARFRRHPLKEGNMTVALTNFDPRNFLNPDEEKNDWYSSVFIGSGKDFILKTIPKNSFTQLGKIIEKHNSIVGKKFIKDFNKEFSNVIGKTHVFQDAYVNGRKNVPYEPNLIVDKVGTFLLRYNPEQKFMTIPHIIPEREQIPTRQVFAMYAINRIIS